MATLLLTDDGWTSGDDRADDMPTLRTWLRDGWAVMFSHPDDFIAYDLESDRLLSVIRKAYADRGVRPMAVTADPLAINRGWVASVSGEMLVRLDEGDTSNKDVVDLRTRTLSEHLRSIERRFVVLVDGLLRRRKTFVYERSAGLLSPLDFLVYVDRFRTAAGGSTSEAADPALARERSDGVPRGWTDSHPHQGRKGRHFNGYAYSRH
jgi:hypothetical protein